MAFTTSNILSFSILSWIIWAFNMLNSIFSFSAGWILCYYFRKLHLPPYMPLRCFIFIYLFTWRKIWFVLYFIPLFSYIYSNFFIIFSYFLLPSNIFIYIWILIIKNLLYLDAFCYFPLSNYSNKPFIK